MVTTRKLKLYPNKKLKQRLHIYSNRFFGCLQGWVRLIYKEKSTSLTKLHHKYYFDLKSKYKISGQSVQLAQREAIYMVRKNKGSFFKRKFAILWPLKIEENRIRFTFGDYKEYWCRFGGQKIPKGVIGNSKIKYINKKWHCFLSIRSGVPKVKFYKRYLGIDLGIAKIAVICDSKGKHCRFFDGEQARFTRSHYYQLRKKSQPNIKEGNVYKFLKRISKKESDWMNDTNHKISREIVNEAIKQRKGIALENLTGITERLKFNKKTKRMIKSWPFRQLRIFIEYKAKMGGIPVMLVDPRGTSKTCPKCLHATRSNRPKQALFRCVKCDYQSNADRVGAMNIARLAEDTVKSA